MIPFSATLLAGGRSTRMGRDKCLIEIGGVPLWRRQYELLRELTDDVSIAAPSRPSWCPADVRWIEDEGGSNSGPLGGLAAALQAAAHGRVLVLAVDLPAMTAAYLERLLTHSTETCGAAPLIGDLFQPLSAIYPRNAFPIALEHLAEADKSLQRFIRRLIASGEMSSVPVREADLSCFRNLNTAAD